MQSDRKVAWMELCLTPRSAYPKENKQLTRIAQFGRAQAFYISIASLWSRVQSPLRVNIFYCSLFEIYKAICFVCFVLDNMSERLRRWPAKPLCFTRAGSNPAVVDF